MAIRILSFGFKYTSDLPNADLLFDLRRRLANPRNHLPKGAIGTDTIVRQTVMGPDGNRKVFTACLERVQKVLRARPDAVIAFGCKSGIHRSVVFAEETAARLRKQALVVEVEHLHLRRRSDSSMLVP